MMDKPFY